MSVPTKSKLAYAWERAAHKDMMYSHVFEKALIPSEMKDPRNTYSKPKRAMWIKATPIEGQPDTFKLDICRHDTFGYIGSTLEYAEIPIPGVSTREQALTMIKAHEQAWLKSMQPMRSQPFIDFIKTKLTP
jgi:hypothetical protein